MSVTRIVLADEQTLFREALGTLLDGQPAMTVVGYAADAAGTLRSTAAHQPDLVLLDPQLPGADGPSTVRAILAAAPLTRIVVLSACAEPALAQRLLAAGASGFLHKGVDRESLLLTLAHTVAVGRQTIPPLHRRAPRHAEPVRGRDYQILTEPLSRREYQVLLSAAAAKSNRQIAADLEITEGTVKRHLHNVFRKLGAVSRLDAVNKAVQASLIPSPVAFATLPGRGRELAVAGPGLRSGVGRGPSQ